MVRHGAPGTRAYWTLPGGGVEAGESFEAAVVRELREETGMGVRVVRTLWEGPWNGGRGTEACFLVEALDAGQEPALGFDPEEAHLDSGARTLKAAVWRPLAEERDDPQVKRVLESLGRQV